MGEDDGLVHLRHNNPTPHIYVREGGRVVEQVDATQRDRVRKLRNGFDLKSTGTVSDRFKAAFPGFIF